MNDYEFYHNWSIYGGLAGCIGAVITVYIYGKKKGVENLNWKINSLIIAIFFIPTVILPLLLTPDFSILEKTSVIIFITLFMALRYFATTKGQEATQKLRDMKKELEESRDKNEEKENWF